LNFWHRDLGKRLLHPSTNAFIHLLLKWWGVSGFGLASSVLFLAFKASHRLAKAAIVYIVIPMVILLIVMSFMSKAIFNPHAFVSNLAVQGTWLAAAVAALFAKVKEEIVKHD
jgi:hypothetical protein